MRCMKVSKEDKKCRSTSDYEHLSYPGTLISSLAGLRVYGDGDWSVVF